MKKSMRKLALLFCICLGIISSVAAVMPVVADNVSLVSNKMIMEKGASLYLDEVSGLKFSYSVTDYSEDKNYGMVIVPYDYLAKANITDLSDQTNDYVNALETATFEYAPIIVENLKANADGVISHSIGKLNEHNYAREFFGIGFEEVGDSSYVYAQQNDNVRSVFEVANLALNVHYYDGGDYDGDGEISDVERADYDLIAEYTGNADDTDNTQDDTLDNFVEKAYEFAYGTSKPTLTVDATTVNDEVTPTLVMPTSEKGITLDTHWRYSVNTGASYIEVTDEGDVKGLSRGQGRITAKLGNTSVYTRANVDVLKDQTELAIYNNSGKADFFVEELTENKNVLGSVSIEGGNYRSRSAYATDTGYVALINPNTVDGKYTLDENGTYVDIYFTGNNMPNVEFFGSTISGNMWNDGTNTGFVVNNGYGPSGLYDNYSIAKDLINTTDYSGLESLNAYAYNGIVAYPEYFRYAVSDYNKLSAEGNTTVDKRVTTTLAYKASSGWVSDHKVDSSNFSMWTLMQDETKKWHYTVGMYKDSNNNVYLDAKLYEIMPNGTELVFAQYNPLVTTINQTISGYVVLHGAVKGENENGYRTTEYAYTLPYAGTSAQHTGFNSSDASFSADGSVVLKTSSINTATKETLDTKTMGYLALDGSFGLNTYLDIYFTGNNMPMVSFFGKYITSVMTDYVDGTNTNTGIVAFNAFNKQSGAAGSAYYAYRYTVCGPNRVSTTSMDGSRLHQDGGSTEAKASVISAPVLATMPDQQFKYTVGFYLNTEEIVCISVDVDKVDAEGNFVSDYYSIDKALSITESDIQGDRIILYGGFVGTHNPTFRYSAPYTK